RALLVWHDHVDALAHPTGRPRRRGRRAAGRRVGLGLRTAVSTGAAACYGGAEGAAGKRTSETRGEMQWSGGMGFASGRTARSWVIAVICAPVGALAQEVGDAPVIGSATLPRDLSPWGMYLNADPVVKAVLIGLAFASLVTWTVWLAKTIEIVVAK